MDRKEVSVCQGLVMGAGADGGGGELQILGVGFLWVMKIFWWWWWLLNSEYT